MRRILYFLLALSYAMTLAARSERAAWMANPTLKDRVALWLPLIGLAVLLVLGFRRTTTADGRGLLALAFASAFGYLLLTLVPSIQ